jgi:hypothetical protein
VNKCILDLLDINTCTFDDGRVAYGSLDNNLMRSGHVSSTSTEMSGTAHSFPRHPRSLVPPRLKNKAYSAASSSDTLCRLVSRYRGCLISAPYLAGLTKHCCPWDLSIDDRFCKFAKH